MPWFCRPDLFKLSMSDNKTRSVLLYLSLKDAGHVTADTHLVWILTMKKLTQRVPETDAWTHVWSDYIENCLCNQFCKFTMMWTLCGRTTKQICCLSIFRQLTMLLLHYITSSVPWNLSEKFNWLTASLQWCNYLFIPLFHRDVFRPVAQEM